MSFEPLLKRDVLSILPDVDNTPGHIKRFLQSCHKHDYNAKTLVRDNYENNETLYYILEGSVAVNIEDFEAEGESTLTYLYPGDFFGELEFFNTESNQDICVVTREKCKLASISYTQFRELVRKDSNLLLELATQVATRLSKTNQKVGNLIFKDPKDHIYNILVGLSKEVEAMTHPEGKQIHISRKELGKLAGCCRETAGRAVKQLVEQGVISAQGKTIVVLERFLRV